MAFFHRSSTVLPPFFRRSSAVLAVLLLGRRLAEGSRQGETMLKNTSRISFALALGLISACGSQDGEQVTGAACVSPTDASCRIAVDENSFVRWASLATDGVAGGISTGVVRYAPGRFCMSGRVDSGPTGSGWGAILIVGLNHKDESGALIPLDVSAHGISQIRFGVDDPPIAGLLPQLAQLQSADCTIAGPDCITTFSVPTYVIAPGTVTEPLTAFSQGDGTHSNPALDQTLITGLQFYVPTLPGMAYDYDFCVRNLAFLDAAGQEVTP
jgi:hypothetical protein